MKCCNAVPPSRERNVQKGLARKHPSTDSPGEEAEAGASPRPEAGASARPEGSWRGIGRNLEEGLRLSTGYEMSIQYHHIIGGPKTPAGLRLLRKHFKSRNCGGRRAADTNNRRALGNWLSSQPG